MVVKHVTNGRPLVICGYTSTVNDCLAKLDELTAHSKLNCIHVDVYHPDDYEKAMYTHLKTKMVIVSLPTLSFKVSHPLSRMQSILVIVECCVRGCPFPGLLPLLIHLPSHHSLCCLSVFLLQMPNALILSESDWIHSCSFEFTGWLLQRVHAVDGDWVMRRCASLVLSHIFLQHALFGCHPTLPMHIMSQWLSPLHLPLTVKHS